MRRSARVAVALIILLSMVSFTLATDLYRSTATGTWGDGNWEDSGSTPQAEPTATDHAWIGGSDGPVTPAGVDVIATGEVVSNLYIGRPGAVAADTGSLNISNNAALTVHGSVHFGDQQAPASSFTMGTNTSLTVNGDFFAYHGTVNWSGTIGISNEVRVGLYDSPSYSDYGKLILDGATATVGGRLTMAYTSPSEHLSYGDLTLTNGSTLHIGEDLWVCTKDNAHGGTLTVGPDCKLIIDNDFWIVDDDNDITLDKPNTNKYQIGGELKISKTKGDPDVVVNGGWLLVDSIQMPPLATQYGTKPTLYLQNGATVSVRRAVSDVINRVGQSSHYPDSAHLYIGTATHPGTINIFETGASGKHDLGLNLTGSYTVADPDKNTSVILGWGRIDLDGTLENNGKVVADGYGMDRDLIMTNFAAVAQNDSHAFMLYDNFYLGDGSHAGWYAVNNGRLMLPPLTGLTANATVRWADTIDDTTTFNSNDLVNSLLLDFSSCNGGDVAISLLAVGRADHDATNDAVIGVWDIDGSAFDFGGSGTATVKFRYDELAAAAKLLNEDNLKAWQYSGGVWSDVTASTDSTNKIVTTSALSSFSTFAVSLFKPNQVGGLVLPKDLYRTNAVGEWYDGTWIDSGSSPAPDPTLADDVYIGGDDGIGVADASVTVTGLTLFASNVVLGADSDSVNDGESGRLVLTNGASLRMEDFGVGGMVMGIAGKYSHGEIDMAAGTTLTVDRDAWLNNSSWNINSNHTVTIAGDLTLNDLSASSPNPTARLTIDGGTRSIGGDLILSTYYFQNAYLTLTNGATFNVNGDLTTYRGQIAALEQYISIDEGSMLNVSGDFGWEGNSILATISGDRVTIGGSLKVCTLSSYAQLAIDGGQLVVDSLLVPATTKGYASHPEFHVVNSATVSVRRAATDVTSWFGMSSHLGSWGDFYLGTATDPGTINAYETGESGKLSLSIFPVGFYKSLTMPQSAPIEFKGWGRVDLDGTLENNGKVIANGYGSDRDLVMTNFAAITQDDVHTNLALHGFLFTDGTRPGWYAIDGGNLMLPPLTNLTAHSTVRWGDTIDDLVVNSNDLVNSAMLNFTNCTGGDIAGSIMATNRADDDVLFPDTVIGIWEFDGSAFTFGGGKVQLTFRYDDILRAAKGLTEADLKVWKFPGFGNNPYWEDVTDSVDTDANLITATWQGSLSQFVVSTAAPGAEPPAGTMIILK